MTIPNTIEKKVYMAEKKRLRRVDSLRLYHDAIPVLSSIPTKQGVLNFVDSPRRKLGVTAHSNHPRSIRTIDSWR